MARRVSTISGRLGIILSWVLLGAGGGGCIGSRPPEAPGTKMRLEHSFPKQEELQALAKESPGVKLGKASEKAPLGVGTWELSGPFPAQAGSLPYTGDDALARAVAAQMPSKQLVITENMQCLAREAGLFFATHAKRPQNDLLGFMSGRCGAIPAERQYAYLISDGELKIASAAKEIANDLKTIQGPAEVGVWKGRGAKGNIAFAIWGRPQVEISNVQVSPDSSSVEIKGTLLELSGWLRSYASEGEFGASKCRTKPGARESLPKFNLICPSNPKDAYTVLDITAGAPRSILGRRVLGLVVPLNGNEAKHYTAITTHSASNSQQDLLAEVNAIRARLKRGLLENVPAQSKAVQTLLPHFMSAYLERDQPKLDKITLGIMAGWNVKGPIRDAGFASFFGSREENGPSVLSEQLFFPSARALLLDKDARQVAFATETSAKDNTAYGIVATYALFEPRDMSPVEQALLDELDRQRAAQGKKAVQRVDSKSSDSDDSLNPIMASLARGEVDPAAGLNRVLNAYANQLKRPFKGMVYLTMVIDGWRPDYDGALLELDDVAVTARVGFYIDEGSSWGQYVVYLIFMPINGQPS